MRQAKRIIGVALIASWCSVATAWSAIDPGSAIGVWLFDEGSGTVVSDMSGSGNDAGIEGEPKWVEGVFGMALDFDGVDDYLTVSSSATLNPTDAITLSVWVNPDGPANMTHDGTSAQSGGIIAKNEATGYLLKSWDGVGASGITWHFSVAGDWSKAVTAGIVGEWQHVVATYDGADAEIYLNGEFKAGNAKTGPISGADAPLGLGIRIAGDLSGDHTARFKGMIDDVAIFAASFSEDDVNQLMNNGAASVLGVTAVS